MNNDEFSSALAAQDLVFSQSVNTALDILRANHIEDPRERYEALVKTMWIKVLSNPTEVVGVAAWSMFRAVQEAEAARQVAER